MSASGFVANQQTIRQYPAGGIQASERKIIISNLQKSYTVRFYDITTWPWAAVERRVARGTAVERRVAGGTAVERRVVAGRTAVHQLRPAYVYHNTTPRGIFFFLSFFFFFSSSSSSSSSITSHTSVLSHIMLLESCRDRYIRDRYDHFVSPQHVTHSPSVWDVLRHFETAAGGLEQRSSRPTIRHSNRRATVFSMPVVSVLVNP